MSPPRTALRIFADLAQRWQTNWRFEGRAGRAALRTAITESCSASGRVSPLGMPSAGVHRKASAIRLTSRPPTGTDACARSDVTVLLIDDVALNSRDTRSWRRLRIRLPSGSSWAACGEQRPHAPPPLPASGTGSEFQAFANTSCPPSASTRTVSPLPNSPARIFCASGFSSCCWIARFSGRAP